jgi:hypothetical protein
MTKKIYDFFKTYISAQTSEETKQLYVDHMYSSDSRKTTSKTPKDLS